MNGTEKRETDIGVVHLIYPPSMSRQQKTSQHHSALTILHYDVSLSAINFLAADDVAGGISEIDEFGLSVEVQGSWVIQVLDGDDVLVIHPCMHVHSTDDTRPAFTVHQEELMLWF